MENFSSSLPLSRSVDAQADIVDLALWGGQLMLQYGAQTQKVEECVETIALGLGCERVNILITHNGIILTTISGNDYKTKTRRVYRQGVNFRIVSDLSRLVQKIAAGKVDRFKTRAVLMDIDTKTPHYDGYFTALMVALACGSFCMIFGGGAGLFSITFISAFFGIQLRQHMIKKRYNTLVTTSLSAFTATLLAGISLHVSDTPELAFAASVLYLVPGVPLINSAQDLFYGHTLTGITRGVMGLLISAAIAFGMLLALNLLGAL